MNLTLSLAQMDVATANPKKNLEKTVQFATEAKEHGADLIVFPEMWTTGFNWKYNKEHAHEHIHTEEKIQNLAKKLDIWIHGSLPTLAHEGKLFNSSILFSPQGEKLMQYNKIHLFSFVGEHQHMEPGESIKDLKTPWGHCGFAICYDLRFPELFRTYAIKGTQLVFLPSAFPHPRLPHWKTLIRARAIENQMFMIACNQVGTKRLEKEVTFFGNSCIIDPWGETVVQGEDKEQLLTASINLSEVKEVREYMQVLKDRRPSIYQNAQ